MLGGMFAFIHDKKKTKKFSLPDIFWKNPLYYLKDIDSLMWASELKSIIKILPVKPAINKPALNLFFN
jgi:asparagine synthase (glutamine-hydrolysing)